MNVFFLGVIVSIVVYLVVGLLAGRKVKDIDDYYVSGRNAPTILIAGTLFASMLSVNGFMGDQGFCYTGNITTLVLLNSMCACGYVFGPLFFGRYLRRSECGTMPEYFGVRYKDPRIRRVAGIITIISLTAYLLACITGVGILMQELTGLSYELCLFIAWACFTAFTFYSGSKGVIITDTMMFMVFIVAAIIAGPYIFNAQGGLGSLLENLMNNPAAAEGLLDYHGNIPGTGASDVFGAVMYAVTMGIIWFITVGVSPWQAGRNLMAKNEHVIFRAGAVAAVCTTVFLLYVNLMSISVINLAPNLEDPQRVLIWAAFNVMPKLVGTLLLAGIMAAGLSCLHLPVGGGLLGDLGHFPRSVQGRETSAAHQPCYYAGGRHCLPHPGLSGPGRRASDLLVCLPHYCRLLAGARRGQYSVWQAVRHWSPVVHDGGLLGLHPLEVSGGLRGRPLP